MLLENSDMANEGVKESYSNSYQEICYLIAFHAYSAFHKFIDNLFGDLRAK